MSLLRLSAVLALTLAGAPVLAHTGVGSAPGFWAGLGHPLAGADHVLATGGVGLVAAVLGGRALWVLPASFLAMMLAGAVLGLSGVPLPAAEVGIALSVVAFGVLLLAGGPGLWIAAALVAAFAVFHGHAHGSEMPAGADALAFGAGFTLATAALHATGIAVGLSARGRPGLVRLGGVGLALAGLTLALA